MDNPHLLDYPTIRERDEKDIIYIYIYIYIERERESNVQEDGSVLQF